MRATTKLAAVAAGCAALCSAEASDAAGWVKTPTPEQADAAYPQKARNDGIAGDVWLSCRIATDGALKGCEVSFENPRGYDFGAAALKLSAALRADPSVAGRGVNVPFHLGPPVPDRPVRDAAYKTSDGRFSIKDARFRKLAPIGPYWPDAALREGLAGKAVMDCTVDDKSQLRKCAVVQSTHPMFAWATLKMAEQGWMSAGAAPSGGMVPADGVWRFVVDYPARTLADAR